MEASPQVAAPRAQFGQIAEQLKSAPANGGGESSFFERLSGNPFFTAVRSLRHTHKTRSLMVSRGLALPL